MHFLIFGTDNIEGGGGGGGAEVICGAFRQVTLLPYDFKLSFVPLFSVRLCPRWKSRNRL